MRLAFIVCAVAALSGCAMAPENMAQRSDYDVCRFTMGGPHSNVAHFETQRRGLDCRPFYGAISQQQAADAANTANIMRMLNPPAQPMNRPVNCQSYRVGNTIQTTCN